MLVSSCVRVMYKDFPVRVCGSFCIEDQFWVI